MVLVCSLEEGHKHQSVRTHWCVQSAQCLSHPAVSVHWPSRRRLKVTIFWIKLAMATLQFSLSVALLSLESVPSHQPETSFWIESHSEVRTCDLHAFWVCDSSIWVYWLVWKSQEVSSGRLHILHIGFFLGFVYTSDWGSKSFLLPLNNSPFAGSVHMQQQGLYPCCVKYCQACPIQVNGDVLQPPHNCTQRKKKLLTEHRSLFREQSRWQQAPIVKLHLG